MLDEYLGRRFIEGGSGVVEKFYPHELSKANIFRNCLKQYATSMEPVPEIGEEVGRQGHVSIISPTLAGILNSYYDIQFESQGSILTTTNQAVTHASLSIDVFQNTDQSKILPFLAGAYFRYGSDQAYCYANSVDRVHLVAELLRMIGCGGVNIQTNEGYPTTHCIHFEPTEELDLWITALPR